MGSVRGGSAPPGQRPRQGDSHGEQGNRAYSAAVPKLTSTKDWSVQGAMANGVTYNGQYTGELSEGKPEGYGTLVLDSMQRQLYKVKR